MLGTLVPLGRLLLGTLRDLAPIIAVITFFELVVPIGGGMADAFARKG